jgi:hypothetical protein
VTAAAVLAIGGVAWPMHLDQRKAKEVFAYLVPSYELCDLGHADTCVGPVRHPDDTDPSLEDPDSCWSIPVAQCESNRECRLACRHTTLDDTGCAFTSTGYGFIKARASAGDVSLKVRIRGLDAGCVGQRLLMESSQQLSSHACSTACLDCSLGVDKCEVNASCIDPGCTTWPQLLGDYGLIGCTVKAATGGGSCDFNGKLDKTIAGHCDCTNSATWDSACFSICNEPKPLYKGLRNAIETYDGTLVREDGRTVFEAGLYVGPRTGALPSPPIRADYAKGNLVTAYRESCTGPGAEWRSNQLFPALPACTSRRNDPDCTFGETGWGYGTAQVIDGPDVAIDVYAYGLDCDDQTLCLSASQRVTTEECDGPPCGILPRTNERIGRADWSDGAARTGCKVVTNGSVHIHTTVNTLTREGTRPGIIRPGVASAGAFFKTGLVRVNADGTPISGLDPAFLVGLIVR